MRKAVFSYLAISMACIATCVGLQPGAAVPADHSYRLEIVHRTQKIVLRSYPVEPGEEFCLHYTHSSDHTPIVDRFQVTSKGQLVLVEEKFAWYGSGLAFHPRENIDLSKTWTQTHMYRHMDPFYLRVGRVAGHNLHIQDQVIALQDIAPGGTSLLFRVRPKGESCHE
ncbi:MAG: DUF1850 domain-containing protein [Desulfovermiculus sp.]